ncbi:MAG: tetratricopeptide repeat protein [Fibrobacter sp.]|nr:tetratricopeptide repeat protein [Fibrobacter sp.]
MNIRISAIALACLFGISSSLAADPRLEQGARFEAKGEYDMALGEYRSILAEDPRNSDAYFAAAEVRVKMKDYSGALANYRLAYKFNASMSAAYEGAAKVYELLGQKAKADAERMKDPKNKPAEEVAAEATPAAEPVAEAKAAEPAPAAEPAVPTKKIAEVQKAEPAPAAEPAKTAEPAKVEPVKEPAKVAEAPKAEPAKAEPAAASEDPFEKGKALLAEGKYKEAAPLWREVLSKKPGHAGAYFYAGVTRYEMGEFDKAEFNLKKGLTYAEQGNDANYYLAMVYQKTNRKELEKKSLAAYLKKAAPDGRFRKPAEDRLAELNAPAVQDSATPAEAVAAAEPAPVADTPKVVEAPKAEPQAATAEGNSIANANMLFKAGSFEAALQMYKALLDTEISPDERYFAMLQMGNIYREMRDFHSAVTRYREVVQQFPDSDWATEAEHALEDAVWLEKHASELPRRAR